MQWEEKSFIDVWMWLHFAKVIYSSRDGRENATVLIDAGTNEDQYVLLLSLYKKKDFIVRKIVHHVDAQCLQCCHINTVATPTYNMQGILFVFHINSRNLWISEFKLYCSLAYHGINIALKS